MATVTYDPNKDYSDAIEAAKKAGQSTTQLEAERAAKIADMYGGVEPMYNGTNQTYSQYSASKSTGSIGSSSGSTSKSTTASSGSGSSVSNGLENYTGNSPWGQYIGDGGTPSKVTKTAADLGYSGNDPVLSAYYNYLADLYNNDKAAYNKEIKNTSINGNTVTSTPNMSRNIDLAGKVVAKGDYAVYYDENGYATKATKIGSGTSVQDLNNSGYYTGTQRTWADVTGNSPSQVYGVSDASIFDGYGSNGAAGGVSTAAGGATGVNGATGGAGYDANVDYSDLLNNAINSGASWQTVQSILNQRNAKINSNPNLSQYLYDENYARAMQYIYTKQQNEAQLEANIAALKGAYDQSVSDYTAAKDKITPQYQAERNQTAASSDVNWNQFAQVAAANGLNTGAIGQAALSRAVTQQNNLNALNQSEAEDLSDIDLEISKLQAEYNSAIAQAQANGNAELAAELYDQFNSYITQKRQAQANQLAMQQAAAEAEQARQEDAYNLVVDLITSGLMPTDTQLAAAGMTKADAQYLYNQIIAQKLNGKKGSTGGSGGSKSSSSSSGGGSGSAGSVSTTTTYKPATDLNTGLNNIASANAGGDTGNYAAVSRELLNMRRSGSSDKTMADYLEKQIDNGVVTENQAYQLVNTYGINLNAQNGTKTETSKTTIDLSAFPQPIYTQKK